MDNWLIGYSRIWANLAERPCHCCGIRRENWKSLFTPPTGGERLPISAVAQGCGGQVQTCGYFNIISNKNQQKNICRREHPIRNRRYVSNRVNRFWRRYGQAFIMVKSAYFASVLAAEWQRNWLYDITNTQKLLFRLKTHFWPFSGRFKRRVRLNAYLPSLVHCPAVPHSWFLLWPTESLCCLFSQVLQNAHVLLDGNALSEISCFWKTYRELFSRQPLLLLITHDLCKNMRHAMLE